MKNLLETLTRAHGVSGDERAIRATIRQAAEPYADDITEDALGNLIVHQKGAGKKIMLAAHMDSVGVIVTHIEKSGFLRFGAIGGLESKALYQTMVRFQNGTVGVIAVEESKEEKEFKLADLYIDIGARDRDEAKTMVTVGDTAAFAGALSGNGNRVMGPYLDNRAGCAVLLETMKQTQHPTNDLYYVFTTQEEVGMRGAKPAAWAVDPEYALAVDVTCPDDQPGALHEATTKLGGGAAIKIMDHSVLCHREVVAKLRQLAAEKKIPAQDDLLKVGGTDAGVIHVSRGGVRTGGVSIPCRYTHSQTELIDLADLEACVKLVQAFCESEFE